MQIKMTPSLQSLHVIFVAVKHLNLCRLPFTSLIIPRRIHTVIL